MVKKILIVDDDVELGAHLVKILTDAGYQNDAATSCSEALEKMIAGDYDLILLDMIMPQVRGADCLVELKKSNPRSQIIVLTAFATIKNAVDVIRKGASDYMAKPFKMDELLMTIKRVLEEASFEKRSGKRDFHGILSSLSNPIRSEMIRMLHIRKKVRLIEITRELDIEDRTKVLFHLRKLQDSGIVEHDRDNVYSLTSAGERSLECLNVLERYLSTADGCDSPHRPHP